MEIIKELSIYRDGGTKVVQLENFQHVYINNRIGSKDRGTGVYDKYPLDKTAKLIGKHVDGKVYLK